MFKHQYCSVTAMTTISYKFPTKFKLLLYSRHTNVNIQYEYIYMRQIILLKIHTRIRALAPSHALSQVYSMTKFMLYDKSLQHVAIALD